MEKYKIIVDRDVEIEMEAEKALPFIEAGFIEKVS